MSASQRATAVVSRWEEGFYDHPVDDGAAPWTPEPKGQNMLTRTGGSLRLLVAAGLAFCLAAASPAGATCQLVPPRIYVCSQQVDVTTEAAAIRERAGGSRTSFCAIAKATNAAPIYCGPMPVTADDGVELDPSTPVSFYCWNDYGVGQADLGCISPSGTQPAIITENYR